MSPLEEEKEPLSFRKVRLNTENYNDLAISTAEGKKPYVFVSYKSQDYDQVFSIMAEMQKRYGLRVYYDKAFDKNNDYWVNQMLGNLSYPVCTVVLCFISKSYLSSYATLIELMHSQVGDDYGESIKAIPIFLEGLPMGNGDDFRAYDSKLALESEDTGLPSDGPERTVFNELFEKMVLRLEETQDTYDKNPQTLGSCLKQLKSLEKGAAPVIDTRFTYRLFKEIFNALHSNQFHLHNYEINMEQFYQDFQDKILSAAGDFSPFGEIPEKKTQPVVKKPEPEENATTCYEALEPHEYVMEHGVLKSVTTQKPYIILPEGCTHIEEVLFSDGGVSRSVFFRGEEKSNGTLMGLVIPDSVKELGVGCFASCTSLKEVTFPQSVARLPNWLFSACSGLERVTLSDSVKELGEGVFFQCSNLKEVILPQGLETVSSALFAGCSSLEEVVIPDSVRALEKQAFLQCTRLTKVTLPQGIRVLPFQLFSECSSLERAVIPDSVRELENMVFCQCESLKEVILPQGMIALPKQFFASCRSLEQVVIPDSVRELGEGVFIQCTKLKEAILPQGVSVLPYQLFADCGSLEQVAIPDSVVEMGKQVFWNCTNLKEVTLPQGIVVDETVFEGCHKELHFLYLEGAEAVKEYLQLEPEEYELDSETVLLKVTTEKEYIILPEGVAILGEGSLGGLSGLKGVQFPDSLREVDEASFIACPNLKEIQLPTGMTALNRFTFSGCSSLEELTLPSGVISVEEKALEGCTSLKKLVLSEGMTQCPEGLFGDAPPLEEIQLPSTLEEITIMDAFGRESSVLAGCTSLKTVVFGGSGTTIPAFVCHSCGSLEQVVLPDTLTAIETGAFTGCALLKEISLPPELSQVKEYGFKGCTSLVSITLPDGVREVGRSAFGQCSNLKEIILPEGVTVVEDYTFEGCVSLERVIFPSTLTHVKIGAFLNCKSLKMMNLSPTVKVEENAFRGCVALQQ